MISPPPQNHVDDMEKSDGSLKKAKEKEAPPKKAKTKGLEKRKAG